MGAHCPALRSLTVASVAIALLAFAAPLPAADECTITLYGTASDGIGPSTLYVIHPPSGAALPVGPAGSIVFINVGAIAFHPVTGLLYGGTALGELITIDTTTGTGTLVGPMVNTSTNFGLKDLSVRKSDGTLFLLSKSKFSLGQYGTCLTSTAGPPLVADGDDPPPGDGFIYLFQGEDTACGGLGSLGHTMLGDWPSASSDAERVNLDPLACP